MRSKSPPQHTHTLSASADAFMNEPTHSSAPIWRQLAALLYDSFILLALSFLYSALVTAIAAATGEPADDYQPMFNGVLFPLGWVLTLTVFYCFFWHRSGQTVGMKTWRIKVVREEDASRTPTWWRCALRAVVAAPAVMFFGIGYIYGALQPSRQTLQDKLSATKVLLVGKDGR